MIRPARVAFNYRTVEGPWGGANAFLRGLKAELARRGPIRPVDVSDPYDILFINQLGRGPGRPRLSRRLTSPGTIRRIATHGTPSALRSAMAALGLTPSEGKPIVCRLVNLVRHAYGSHARWSALRADTLLFNALRFTDLDVFQSEYIRGVFREAGYAKPGSHVISNGTDPRIFPLRERAGWRTGSPLAIFSCTFATRASKRFDVIAAFSQLPGVESFHIGSWPAGVDSGRVTMLGRKSPEECAALYREAADLFLHPAERDICPNVVVEALSSGVPVLFGTHGGTSEIVRDCGVAIDGAPGEVLDRARAGYGDLVERVRSQHYRFSIERAADDYCAVFYEALRRRRSASNSE